MKKYIVTPAFCKASVLEANFKNIASAPPMGFKRVVVDGHYPIDKEENRARIKQLCALYDAIYLDPGMDMGLHRNLNYAIEQVGIGPEDVMFGLDPDDFPAPGSIDKITEIMQLDRGIAVCANGFSVIYQRVKEGHLSMTSVGSHVVYIHRSVEMFRSCGWNMRFIHSLPTKFHQPNNYYGGIECYLFPKWKQQGLKLAYVQDTCDHVELDRNDPKLFDKSLRKYKDAHLGGFKGSFEEYIKRNPVL